MPEFGIENNEYNEQNMTSCCVGGKNWTNNRFGWMIMHVVSGCGPLLIDCDGFMLNRGNSIWYS